MSPAPPPLAEAGHLPAGGDSHAAAPAAPQDAEAPILAALTVPQCQLQYGQQLCLVGGAAELGRWDLQAAPRLVWSEGHTWTAQLALAPGAYACKLVVLHADGGSWWEEGPDRELRVPHLAGLCVPTAGPALAATLTFGDTSPAGSHLRVTAVVDPARLKVRAREVLQG